MSDRMSDERLAELDQRITNGCDTYDCDCDNAPCGLEPREVRELLAEVKRARLAEAGETELEWGVRRRAGRATFRTEDFSQPNEESARARVARSDGFSVLICRTKAGAWRQAEES